MYSKPSDIRDALAPTGTAGSNPTRTAAELSDVQLTDAISEADARIDSFIGRYYTVPVALVNGVAPAPVRWWSRNIAGYLATLTWRRGKDLSPNDPVALRFNLTMQELTSVRDGKSALEIPSASSSGQAQVAQAINPYVGTLWGAEDFDLRPVGSGWPFQPDIPSGLGGNW